MRRKHLVGKKRSPCDSSASFKRNLFFTLIEKFLIFWHFDYEKMWSTCNIYELYSLINCLRNHQHQGLSYLKVVLRKIKACCCFHYLVHSTFHLCCCCWILLGQVQHTNSIVLQYWEYVFFQWVEDHEDITKA